MKRGGPLKRRKPLSGGKGLRRGKPLDRKAILKTNPKPRPRAEAQAPGATGWTQRVFALYGRACLACPRRDQKPAVQAHHVVPRQRILNAPHLAPEQRAALAYDARNGLPVCLACHGDHESPGVKGRRIPRARLRPEHLAWAYEHGFATTIDDARLYP